MTLDYPGANQRYRFDSRHPNQRFTGGPRKLVLHTTETDWLPGYQEGHKAPNLSVGLSDKTLIVYQHYSLDRPSRALRHPDGEAQTNNEAIQIELIGTCLATVAQYRGYFYWPVANDHVLRQLGEIILTVCGLCGIDPVPTSRPWLDAPAGYGTTSARMSSAEWDAFGGICGHLHVPGNTHSDPGSLRVQRALDLAGDQMLSQEDKAWIEAAIRNNVNSAKVRWLEGGDQRVTLGEAIADLGHHVRVILEELRRD